MRVHSLLDWSLRGFARFSTVVGLAASLASCLFAWAAWREFQAMYVVILFFSLSDIGQSDVAPETPDSVPSDEFRERVDSLFAARRQIRSGRFVVSVDRTVLDGAAVSEGLRFSGTAEIWLDDERVRVDWGSGSSTGDRQIKCLGCYGDGSFVEYSTAPVANGRMMVSIRDADDVQVSDFLVNPRWVGLIPTFFSATPNFHIESTYATADPRSLEIDSVMLDGRRCSRMTWRAIDPATRFVCWFDSGREGVVPRVEQHWQNGETQVVESLVSEYRFIDDARLWYPQMLTFTQEFDGEAVLRETVEIEAREINHSFDSDAFSISSFPGVEDGTPVQWVSSKQRPAQGRLAWNGHSVASAPPLADLPIGQRRDGVGKNIKMLVFANVAVVLGFIALLCLRISLRRKNKPT